MQRAGESSSVFTDDSGSRARRLQWGLRAAVAAFLVAVVLIVVSLSTGVPLPGLDGPVRLPGTEKPAGQKAVPADRKAPVATTDPTEGPARTTSSEVAGPAGSAPEAGSSAAGMPTARPTTRPTSRPTTVPTSAPTNPPPPAPSATGKPTRGPNANSSSAPRADPTKAGGGKQTTPPGKAK